MAERMKDSGPELGFPENLTIIIRSRLHVAQLDPATPTGTQRSRNVGLIASASYMYILWLVG